MRVLFGQQKNKAWRDIGMVMEGLHEVELEHLKRNVKHPVIDSFSGSGDLFQSDCRNAMGVK